MAKNARYRVAYRRRRKYKTDYQARRLLATSKNPRLVVRVSNKGILAQIMKSEIIGDKVLIQATSNELIKKFGWQASGDSIPAAYLLGLIAGHKAINDGIETVYLDLGLRRPTKGSKIFAVVKGAIDAGLNIPCDSDIIPAPERINGGHIANYSRVVDPENYEKKFSAYLRKGLRPESIPEHFDETKRRIQENWSQ